MSKVDLDALEAVLAKATPGDVTICGKPIKDIRVQGVYEVSSDQKAEWKALFMHEADAVAYREAHNALPELLAELRELRAYRDEVVANIPIVQGLLDTGEQAHADLDELRAKTTPEVIVEKHRDGNWWIVWNLHEKGWRRAKWDKSYNEWHLGHRFMNGSPTHALPMPEAPDA